MDTDALGRKALTDVLKNQMKLSQGFASELVSGKKLPSLPSAFEIEDRTGIPVSFWRRKDRGAAMWEFLQQESK